MITDDTLNVIAGYVAVGVAVPAHLLALIYGIGSSWWRSLLGVSLFAKWLSVAFAFDYIISRRLAGDYPGYGLVAIVVYGFVFLAFSATVIELIVERRTPVPIRLRSTLSAMTDPATSEPTVTITSPVEEIWYKAQRVVRAVLVAAIVVVPTLNGLVPLLAQAFNDPSVSPQVYLVVNAVAAGILVITGILTRIMAIPGVNAWLVHLGAGSVPKSAIKSTVPLSQFVQSVQPAAAPDPASTAAAVSTVESAPEPVVPVAAPEPVSEPAAAPAVDPAEVLLPSPANPLEIVPGATVSITLPPVELPEPAPTLNVSPPPSVPPVITPGVNGS